MRPHEQTSAPPADDGPAPAAPTSESNLTRSQLLIWLGQQLNPDAPLYNMVHAFTIDAPVDPEAFDRAFQAFVDRSDAFRTVFETTDGVPRRRVLDHLSAPVEHVDLSAEPDPDAALQSWVRARAGRNFDLGRRLFDAALLRLSADRTVWYLNQHHLITDAWSTTLVYKAVGDYYNRARAGTLADAPGLPLYETFAVYSRRLRESTRRKRVENHWRTRLDAAPVAPPHLYGRSAEDASTRAHRVPLDLGAERSARIRAVAAEPDVRSLTPNLSRFTLFATVLFAYLYRVGGRRDLAIGAPAHNRPTPTFKQTPGLFTEVFPLHVEVRDDDTFASLHARVRDETSAFLRYAQPGASLPGLARGYAAVLNYIHAALPTIEGWPARNAWIHPGHGDRRHAIRLQVHDFEGTDRFQLAFDLNADVFDPHLRAVAPGHFLRLLDGFLADRTQPILAPALLSDEEHATLVVDWNRTDADAPFDRTVVDLFADQAARTPDAPAVRAEGRTLTYAALEARADRLAQHLRARRLGPGARVGLYLRRSADAVVAILGVLKAGAAYVPVSADHPAARVSDMLDDAGTALLLTETALAERIPPDAPPTICVDALADDVRSDDTPGTVPPGGAGPDDLAYIIYTSGSTGRPKGVAIAHRALVNYVWWAVGQYGAGLAFPLFSSLSFDLTVTSVFVPLVSGGQVVVYGERDEAADLTLMRVIEDDAVDIVKLTPSHLELVKHLDLRASHIRQLIVGGEDFKRHLARTVHDAFGGDVALYNEYGPTEATVGCILHRFGPTDEAGASVPIGRPVANTRIYLLDGGGQPVPHGVAGEIHIAGASLADGYWNRPGLTAERFLPDPFKPGARMYRTGDLARFTDADTLVYLGRRDQQVKIRGARIELGDVEAALNAHPAVRAGVVEAVAHEPPPDEREVFHCVRCGLPETYPDAAFDEAGVCHLCRAFDRYRGRAERYFGTMDDLRQLFAEAPRTDGGYDCLMLLSGGKDSTYALARLVDMGLRVLTFTLDNGYISDQAKANIRRVVEALGVEHVFGTTPAMNAIFVDSLKRHSNVCQGCFKTLYTLSLQLAREREIPFIVTGLSRGQFFETRLTEELFTDPSIDADRIDLTILEARKAYHRVDDAVHRLLDVSMFDDDQVFEKVRFVDFYRYCDVALDDMLAYLDERLPWVRPTDTGRSTNCLINDVGIYVHRHERGYHNYALPYSWDVRMGVKDRAAALDELDDEIDEASVRRILGEIGYDAALAPEEETGLRLAAYYVADAPVPAAELRAFLADALPEFMLPSYFIRLDALPLTPNGKVDRTALPRPEEERPDLDTGYVAPSTSAEETLAAIWADVIRVREVGVYDNFFDLGGDSIMAIQIVARAGRAGLHLTPGLLFEHQTVAELAAVARTSAAVKVEQGLVEGSAPLTPVQRWFFEKDLPDPSRWNHALAFDVDERLDCPTLDAALADVLRHHDALRLRFIHTPDGWTQTHAPHINPAPTLDVDLSELDADSRARGMAEIEETLHTSLDLAEGPLLLTALFRRPDAPDRLLVVIHHLAVDGVSWPLLLEDLETAYRARSQGETPELPPKTTSFKRWAERLVAHVEAGRLDDERSYWRSVAAAPVAAAPADGDGPDLEGAARTITVDLDAGQTHALLHDVPPVYHTQVNEVLLTALALALSEWTGRRDVRLDLEGHGREEIVDGVDLSRTVGWFTSLFPVALDLEKADEPGAALRTVKEQVRRIPRRGIGYGLLRYLGAPDDRRVLAEAPSAEVLFNYLGRFDQPFADGAMFRFARELTLTRDPGGRRPHPLEINTFVTDGRLRAEWRFAPTRHRPETIRRLAERFRDALTTLIRHCQSPDAGAFTPADFPLARLDEAKLDKLAGLLAKLDQPDRE